MGIIEGVLKGYLHHHYLPPPYHHRSCLHKRRAHTHAHAHEYNNIYYDVRTCDMCVCVSFIFRAVVTPRRLRSVGKLSSHYCRFHKGRALAQYQGALPLTLSLSLLPLSLLSLTFSLSEVPPHHRNRSRRHSSRIV